MLQNEADATFSALNLAIDSLDSLVERSVQSVDARPVILTQPPSSRATSLSEAADRVGILTEACRTAGQKIARALSTLQQCQHHCQFALSPISGLPVETMFRIFEFAVTGHLILPRTHWTRRHRYS